MTPSRPTFLALSKEEAVHVVQELGGKAFHAGIIRSSVFEHGILDYDAMTSLSLVLRARLTAELPLLSCREVSRSVAPDRTTKLLLEFADGATVETVHMPSYRDSGKGTGATLCVSTQVGCPVGCPFCASGLAGLARNLAAHEILEQFLLGRELGPLSRSVVMGIGEPLLNRDALIGALQVVNQELGMGARKITVSTVGFPDRLHRLVRELEGRPPFQLAISLHSPDDEQRAELVPAMAGVPVADILAAGDDWFQETGREVTYEYCLLGGLNDTPEHAARLGERLRERRCVVNLIPYNPVDPTSGMKANGVDVRFLRPTQAAAEEFRDFLTEAGVVATIRWSRGVDTDAACGQLRIQRLQA